MRLTRREFGVMVAGAAVAPRLDGRQRLARKDCFFGMHFDLHPKDTDTELGRDVSEEMVRAFLDRVGPDYVQYDYKGHVGYVGYPSKVSTSAPNVKDSLDIWRKVTRERGVGLYIHFSGVLDQLAVEQRPEWARITHEGEPSARETSTFSSYVDERMIPQLKEAIEKYGIDGAWVDGECWGTNPDYGAKASALFEKETGVAVPPQTPGDPGWQEWLEFCRNRFRDYLKHYVDELHAFRPGFEVASNWLYTTFVPERPELPVDFISGDYLGNACISRARLEARYLSHAGKPWDLMAWGFQSSRQNPVGPVHKSSVQLMQESAVVLAQGGGFQIYYQPTRAGKVDDRHIGVMETVARFCRERQELCHKSETVPEIGVLFSGHSLYHTANKLFGGWGNNDNPARGIVDALVENHFCVDAIPDWKLAEVASKYRLIVVPDWPDIGDAATEALLSYANGGGGLLIAGAENARRFEKQLKVRLAGDPERRTAYIPGTEVFADVSGVWQAVEVSGAEVLETRFPTYDSERDGEPAATVNALGKGRILAVYGPLGVVFATTHAPETRRVIGRLVRRLITPSVELGGPPTVEVVRRRKGDREVVHLLNASGMQLASEYSAIDYVPPVDGLKIRIRMDRRPGEVRLEPAGKRLRGEWENGVWWASLPRLEIHAMIAWSS